MIPNILDRVFPDSQLLLTRARAAASGVYDKDTWEPHTTKLIVSRMRAGMRCLDVGANYGWYSALCAILTGPQGYIRAVEPIPACADRVREVAFLLEKQGQVAPVRVDQVFLTDTLCGYTRVKREIAWALDAMQPDEDRKTNSYVVFGMRLDDVNWQGRCDFMKLDVDGHEAAVIAGGHQFFQNFKPMLLLEVGPSYVRRHKGDLAKELRWLTSLGYRFIADHGASMTVEQMMMCPDNTTWNVLGEI